MNVIVVGAGLGGLASAIRLASAGHRVSVLERQSSAGGKALSEEIDGFRFDTGPSLFTMRHVFEELFAAADRDFSDYVETIPLDRLCRYAFRDGVTFTTVADREDLARRFADTFGEEAERVRAFFDYSRAIYDASAELFLEKSLHSAETYASGLFWRSLFKLPQIDAVRTMAAGNERFFTSLHLRQLFNRYATYNGSNPYRTPATMNIIPWVEYGLGAWAVRGGIRAVPQAMERLARELGVAFHFSRPVDRIVTHRRRVTGVESGGEFLPADVVVTNADVTETYRSLLEDTGAPLFRRYQRLEPSSSGIVFYWGIDRDYRELELHNIFFSGDYRREFAQIFEERTVPADPTIYVNITSRVDPEDAPGGGQNWFVLVNAPADNGQAWDAEVDALRGRVVARLSEALNDDVGAHIVAEGRLTPPEIAERTGSHRGSLYGISSNSRGAAFLRHPNRSRRYRGLYFVGGSAHPGGGMPLVVLGGAIVADAVTRDIHRRRVSERGRAAE